jgi:hypothetical protein
VIDEVFREEFVENVEVSFPLDLFGFSAHNGFCPSGRSDAAHFDTLREMLNPPTPSPPRDRYQPGCELLEQRGYPLEAQTAQARVFIRATSKRPEVLALRLFDWQVIDKSVS